MRQLLNAVLVLGLLPVWATIVLIGCASGNAETLKPRKD